MKLYYINKLETIGFVKSKFDEFTDTKKIYYYKNDRLVNTNYQNKYLKAIKTNNKLHKKITSYIKKIA